jgi:sarcosine oxidase subunit beta
VSVEKADVVVIGAGIVGLASAYWLAKSGAKVIVLDKGRAGWEASGRATGFHSLRGEIPASVRSRLWRRISGRPWMKELGYPTEWVPAASLGRAGTGSLDRAHGHLSALAFRRASDRRLGRCPARVAVVPCLSEQTLGALYMQRSGHLNPQRATQAFAWAFRDRGGEIREETAVTGINVSGGRVTGVETTASPISAPIVITCAGPQSAKIAAMVGVDLPLATVRLEAMVTVPLPPLFDVAMVGHGISLRQTGAATSISTAARMNGWMSI